MTYHEATKTALLKAAKRAGKTQAQLAPELGYSSQGSLSRAVNDPRRLTAGLIADWMAACGCRLVVGCEKDGVPL